MQNILGIIDFKNTDITENVIKKPLYNRSWGTDYMLMDSKTLTGGSDYTQIIDMFQKIWDMNDYRLFSGF